MWASRKNVGSSGKEKTSFLEECGFFQEEGLLVFRKNEDSLGERLFLSSGNCDPK